MSMVQKILLWFLGLILLPTLLVGTLLFVSFRDKITEAALDKLEYTATVQENRIEDVVKENKDTLLSYTRRVLLPTTLHRYNMSMDPADQQLLSNTLSGAKEANKKFKRISILNLDGEVVASSDKSTIGKPAEQHIEGVGSDSDFDLFIEDGELCIGMRGEIYYKDVVVGIIDIEMNGSALESIVSDYSGLGETGETLLAKLESNGDALYITNTRFDDTASLNRVVDSENVDSPLIYAVNDKSVVVLDDISYTGKPVLSIGRPIDDTNWGVVVQIQQSEAYRGITSLLDTLALLLFAILVLGVFIALFASRAITYPLIVLTLAVKRISEGDLSTRVDLARRDQSRKDEFGLLEETINSMSKNLEKLDKLKTEFILLTSHQLRTPASAVKGFLALLLGGYAKPDSAEFRELLQDAYNENERQLHLINQILAISQAESKQLILSRVDVRIDRLARETVKQVKPLLVGRKQKVTLHVSRGKHTVTGDPDKVGMIIENLITNAIKYSPDGTEIKVSIESTDKASVIRVSDSGFGIAPEDMDLLFKKFSRLDNPRSIESQGSGLGLYLVKMLVGLHHGTIEVQSEKGRGATFTVTIPLKKS